VARDRGLPGKGGRSPRSGSSSRKRGIGHLTLVPDPDLVPSSDEHADEPCAAAGSVEEETGADLGGEGNSGTGPGDEGPGDEEAARAICLRLLTAGPCTRAQLATALRKWRIPGEVAESVLSRFTEVGLIDDAAFARAWVESRHHGRGLARRALSAELRQRGIPDGEVRSAVGLLGPQDELATARRLVAKRLPASRGKPMPARARQLMGMLARKGYSAGLAAQVVREALEQEQENDAGHGVDLAWISEDGAGDDWL
jgi:regulatory protein